MFAAFVVLFCGSGATRNTATPTPIDRRRSALWFVTPARLCHRLAQIFRAHEYRKFCAGDKRQNAPPYGREPCSCVCCSKRYFCAPRVHTKRNSSSRNKPAIYDTPCVNVCAYLQEKYVYNIITYMYAYIAIQNAGVLAFRLSLSLSVCLVRRRSQKRRVCFSLYAYIFVYTTV